MEDYQQRVISEKSDLDEKLNRLDAFFDTDVYSRISRDEKNRLEHQRFHMRQYSDILAARIASF